MTQSSKRENESAVVPPSLQPWKWTWGEIKLQPQALHQKPIVEVL